MDSLTIEEITDALCRIWGEVSDKQRSLIRKHINVVEYKKGESIYKESERPRSLAFLVRGKVRIHKEGIGNRHQIVRVIKPYGMFGFRAFFAGQDYETASVAFDRSTVAFIPLNIIHKLIMSNPDIALFFIKDLSVKLGDADQRTINLTQKHIRARLAETLLFLKDIYGVEEDGRTLCIHVSREETANMSNMTTSNAIRTLSSFAEEKLIVLDGRKVKLLDEDGLREISERG